MPVESVALPALVNAVGSLGLPAALLIFFVWRGSKREDLRDQRIESLETRQFESLEVANQKAIEAIARNTEALQQNTTAMNHVATIVTQCTRNQPRGD